MDAEGARGLARAATDIGERDLYLEFRRLVEQGPIPVGQALPRMLLSNPDKGEDGIIDAYHYQYPVVGHMLFQTHEFLDCLMPTGCGKTYGVSMGEGLRMFFETVNGIIISYTDDQTKFIRDEIHRFYETGHPILRKCLEDSPKDEIRIRRPDGTLSRLFCRTANVNNDGQTLLGIQGLTDIVLDERALIPDHIFDQKIDRITAPKGRKRFVVGITTTQQANHTYEWCEAEKLPKRANCNPMIPHVTAQGGLVFKATWRDGVKAGRYTQEFIDRRFKRMGQEQFDYWYECEFPSMGNQIAFPPDLVRSMVV